MINIENIRNEDLKWLIEQTYIKTKNSKLPYSLIEEEILNQFNDYLKSLEDKKVTIQVRCVSNRFSKIIELKYSIEDLSFLDKEDIFEHCFEELKRQGLGHNSDYIRCEIDDDLIKKYAL